MIDNANPMQPGVLIRVGRARMFHRGRVVIRDMKVIVITQCGIERDVTRDGYTETFGGPTCSACGDRDREGAAK